MIDLKKIILFLCCVILATTYDFKKVEAKEIYSRSYVVMDYNSGEVLESKDKDLKRSVASISKIMTAIVAIENCELDKYVEVKEDILSAYGSSIYLKIGEVITMKDLLYGLMLRSGNDAAVTIARGVSSSVEEFVNLMNKKAYDIGMYNSSFNNPSGLDVDDEGNVSTSYDMALLMKYAMNNTIFKEITNTKEYRSNNHGVWVNKNKLLRNYEYATGGKTGFTAKAKRTLVTSAKKETMELIVVTLDCGNDFMFHEKLYEKYFEAYKSFKLLKEGSNVFDEYELYCNAAINTVVEKSEISKSKIIYKIEDESAKVILITNNEEKMLGECKSKKINNKSVKKNKIIEAIKSIFSKLK